MKSMIPASLMIWAVIECLLLISVASKHDILARPVATPRVSAITTTGTTIHKRASIPIISSGYSPSVNDRSVTMCSEEPEAPRRKGLSREDDPDDYWMSKDERDGKSPFQDPLAWAAIAGLIVPFAILGIAIATGYVPIG